MSGISELFTEIGNDNICYQLLHTSMTDIKTKKKDSAVTFLTQQITPNEVMSNTGKIGVVVWVDRDIYIDAVKKVSGAKQ